MMKEKFGEWSLFVLTRYLDNLIYGEVLNAAFDYDDADARSGGTNNAPSTLITGNSNG